MTTKENENRPERENPSTPAPAQVVPKSKSTHSVTNSGLVSGVLYEPRAWVGPRLGWWVGVVVGVIMLLVALGWLLMRVQEPDAGSTSSTNVDTEAGSSLAGVSAGAGSGGDRQIGARPFDAASRPRSEHTLKRFELAAYRELIESDAIVMLDDESSFEWLETRVALLDPVTAFAAEEDCRDRHGDLGSAQRCAYRLAVVLERVGDHAEVVYAKATVDESGDYAECSDLANCMAGTRLGRQASAPAGAGERFAVGMAELSLPSNQDRLQDVEQVRETIAQMEEMLEQAREADLSQEDPAIAFRLAMHERMIEFWRLRLARLLDAAA